MFSKPRECRARVVEVRALGPAVIEADLALEDPTELEFEAGQWISIPFGPKLVRAYSIASTPDSPRLITLAADVAPGGLGSTWFQGLRPGMIARFKGPLGGFVLNLADSRDLLFVAEEIGIVPIRSILRDLGRRGDRRPARLVYWAGHPSRLVYDAEFRARTLEVPTFAYHPLGAEADSAATAASAVGALVDRLTLPSQGLVAYVAGGERTIHRAREVLVARGLERKAVKWEKFW